MTARRHSTSALMKKGGKWTELLRMEGIQEAHSERFIATMLKQLRCADAAVEQQAQRLHAMLRLRSLHTNPLWTLLACCVAANKLAAVAPAVGSSTDSISMHAIMHQFVQQMMMKAYQKESAGKRDADSKADFYKQLASYALSNNEVKQLVDREGLPIAVVPQQPVQEAMLERAATIGLLHRLVSASSEQQARPRYRFFHPVIAEYLVGCYVASEDERRLRLTIDYYSWHNNYVPYFALMAMVADAHSASGALKLKQLMAVSGRCTVWSLVSPVHAATLTFRAD